MDSLLLGSVRMWFHIEYPHPGPDPHLSFIPIGGRPSLCKPPSPNKTSRGIAPGVGRRYKRKFWNELIYSRIVTWGREFKAVLEYIFKNELQALGLLTRSRKKQLAQSPPRSSAWVYFYRKDWNNCRTNRQRNSRRFCVTFSLIKHGFPSVLRAQSQWLLANFLLCNNEKSTTSKRRR